MFTEGFETLRYIHYRCLNDNDEKYYLTYLTTASLSLAVI
jgi:hypothetical protein